MAETKITVAVPIYNMAALMPRALDSLLKQDYRNYEIILVDDGSTDGSEKLCDEYAARNDRVRVIHKENGGLSTARNAGIDAAKGEYIVFPDPDDWVESNYLSTFHDLLQSSGAEIIICGHFVDADGESVRQNSNGRECVLSREEAMKMLVDSAYFCGFAHNKLLNLEKLRTCGLRFDPEHGMAQDLAFMVRLFAQTDTFCYAPQRATYHYYQSPAGVTNGGLSARKISGLQTFEDMAVFCRDNAPFICSDVRATQGNLALTLSHNYVAGKCANPEWKKRIRRSLRRNIFPLCKSRRPLSRKLLALSALISFRFSYFLKHAIRSREA